ncbi:MAG: hypothetical protein IKC21_03890 [Ruminococcus sp.]|nr:hypothetical protein [Ruminococcus sp.]
MCTFIYGNTAQSTPDGFARNLLAFFRHLIQKSLDIRRYACGISVQSDEKTDFASFAQAMCGIALKSQCRTKCYPFHCPNGEIQRMGIKKEWRM